MAFTEASVAKSGRGGGSVSSLLKRGPSWHECGKCGRSHSAPHNWCRTCRIASALAQAEWRKAHVRQRLCWYCNDSQEKTSRDTYNPIALERGRYLTCEYHRQYNNALNNYQRWKDREDLTPEESERAKEAIACWEEFKGGRGRRSFATKRTQRLRKAA